MKVAINGFGRIGRILFRLMDDDSDVDIVAINDLTDAKQLAYLLKYDSVHGNYLLDDISYDGEFLVVKGKKIRVYAEKDPKNLPWGELDIDVVFECTGLFTDVDDARGHIEAGSKKVIVSAPCKGDAKTIVYNVNNDVLTGDEEVISAASCTTNCLAPVLKILDDNFGIVRGYMTTVHAYTNDQANLDVAHPKGIDSRRGRASACNIVPTSTGAASAIGKVIPSLSGKLDGMAMRVPTADGSVIDLTLELVKDVTEDEINTCFKDNVSDTIDITFDPIVSSDVIGASVGSLVDGLSTKVIDLGDKKWVKIISWYDNEASYTNQMIKTAKYWCNLK